MKKKSEETSLTRLVCHIITSVTQREAKAEQADFFVYSALLLCYMQVSLNTFSTNATFHEEEFHFAIATTY